MRFEKSNWTNEAAEALRNALSCDADIIRQQVERKIAELWRAENGAYFVLRREFDTCVVVAYEGSGLLDVAPYIVECARRAGCKEIRFHTTRPALIRLLREYNPEPMEYVCRVNIGSKH
jgi:hypothetical protein